MGLDDIFSLATCFIKLDFNDIKHQKWLNRTIKVQSTSLIAISSILVAYFFKKYSQELYRYCISLTNNFYGKFYQNAECGSAFFFIIVLA